MLPTERLRGIEAFVATADAGSFTAAAERLHLTVRRWARPLHGWRRGWERGCSNAARAAFA
nr:LysR family transcriptional regulator [Stenotrophomonas maltophilia]